MNRKDALLINIASAGYNVGFGAKKNFASYDFTRIIPKLLGFISLVIGVVQVLPSYEQSLSNNTRTIISVVLIIAGMAGLLIDASSSSNDRYERAGSELLSLFNRLRTIYYQVKTMDPVADFTAIEHELQSIEQQARQASISDQMMGTHIWTNLQFFSTMQIEWIDEVKDFKLRDKFPFFHPEAILIYLVMLSALVISLKYVIDAFTHMPRT